MMIRIAAWRYSSAEKNKVSTVTLLVKTREAAIQQLIFAGRNFHPHVHCIVSCGGIDAAGKWVKEKRANGNYLYPKPNVCVRFSISF